MLEKGGRATGVTIEEKPGGGTTFTVEVLEAGQKIEITRNEAIRRKKKNFIYVRLQTSVPAEPQ